MLKVNGEVFLIFSGRNERAVVALCRYFNENNLPFRIVASSFNDRVLRSAWKSNVIFIRENNKVNLDLFVKIKSYFLRGDSIIYCPTTEYINDFCLNNRNILNRLNYRVLIPDKNIYDKLTNKSTSIGLVNCLIGLNSPAAISFDKVCIPCVIKPKVNIKNDIVQYPRLCFYEEELKKTLDEIDLNDWFAQEYVQGQSYYLCGYLSVNGSYSSFWQINLVQQAGGKSIVLAHTSNNPGVNEEALFEGLYELGYFGPIMMEFIKRNDELYFIEINPRFWGPLQLVVDFKPSIIDLFVRDAGISLKKNRTDSSESVYWYSWNDGSNFDSYKLYPASCIYSENEIVKMLEKYDVYNK